LANELHLPLFIVRFDSVIGAYLGQKINWRFTRKKARKVFKYEAPGSRG
jgi:hypothetical protein